jgi:hypothetical protein
VDERPDNALYAGKMADPDATPLALLNSAGAKLDASARVVVAAKVDASARAKDVQFGSGSGAAVIGARVDSPLATLKAESDDPNAFPFGSDRIRSTPS